MKKEGLIIKMNKPKKIFNIFDVDNQEIDLKEYRQKATHKVPAQGLHRKRSLYAGDDPKGERTEQTTFGSSTRGGSVRCTGNRGIGRRTPMRR